MERRAGRVSPGLDGEWIARALAREPVLHAFAAWDLERERQRCRFVTYEAPDRERSYLLIWTADPLRPVVHWIGEADGDEVLEREVPDGTVTAVVPPRVVPALLRTYPTAAPETILGMVAVGPPGGGGVGPTARPLLPRDAAMVESFVDANPDPLTEQYRRIDLGSDRAWGAFEGDRLLGMARAPVRLPEIWMITGVYVAPEARRAGAGAAVVGAVMGEAAATGARSALYVRERNETARRLYERLGFETAVRRSWVDLPTGTA